MWRRPTKAGSFIAILGFAFAVEGALYSAVTPILPLLSRQLGMSNVQAGLMLSSYSSGIVAGSLLCVLVLRRVDARRVAVGALSVLAVSTVIFAWSSVFELALATRLVQGIAGGVTWTACISWLLRLWPIEKRGEALGMAIGPAVVGTIAGPAIGTVAIDLGVQTPYSVVAVLCGLAAAGLTRMNRPPAAARGDIRSRATGGRQRKLALIGASVAIIDGALIGLINLAGPEGLVNLGAAERTGGIVFVIAAIVMVLVARPLGKLVDRRGATPTAASALFVMAILFPVFGAGPGILATGATLVALVLANNLCYVASGALISREGEGAGWSLPFLTAATATVWGLGETAGALLAGLGLEHVGPSWTAIAGGGVAGLTMIGLVLVASSTRRAHEVKDDVQIAPVAE